MQERPPGTRHWDGPPVEAWDPWRPEEAAAHLLGVGVPWCVVAGWAIDLYLGRETRSHHDLEISIPRSGFAAVRGRLSGFALHTVGDGEVRALPAGELPPAEKHQNWVLDPRADAWRMDIMLEPGDAETWVFRRDERIREPRTSMIGFRDGVPFLVPQGVLLYKAKAVREKDEADLRAVLPHLDARARRWLRHALARVHPGHARITVLA
jgi:hypothetical protein